MVASTPLILLALLRYIAYAHGKKVDFRVEVFKEGKPSDVPKERVRDGNDTTCYEVQCGNVLCSVRIVLGSPAYVSRARIVCSPEPHDVYYVHKNGDPTTAQRFAKKGNVLDYGGELNKKVLTVDIASVKVVCEVEIFDNESTEEEQKDEAREDNTDRSVLYTVLPCVVLLVILAIILATYFYGKHRATRHAPMRDSWRRRLFWKSLRRDRVPYDDGKMAEVDDSTRVSVYHPVRFRITFVGSDGATRENSPATVSRDNVALRIKFTNDLLLATAEYEEVEDLPNSGGLAPVYATVNKTRGRPKTPDNTDTAAPIYANYTDSHPT